MSYYDNYESPYEQAKRNRNKMNVNLFPSDNINNNNSSSSWCDVCNVKLIPKDKNMWCKSCGYTFTAASLQQQKNRLTSKYLPETQNKFTVISKVDNKKKRREVDNVNRDLSDEDLAELRRYGFAI